MSDDPSWLTEDDSSTLKKKDDAMTSPHKSSIPMAPHCPKPSATPSRKQVQANNARLEEEGLEFLQTPVADSTPQVVKATKSGVLITDEDLGPNPNQAIGAPVHFLKRMREAEEKRLARLEKIANGESKAPAPTPSRKTRPPSGRLTSPNASSSVYKRLGSATLHRSNSSSSNLDQPETTTTSNNKLNNTMSGGGHGGAPVIGTDGGIVETEVIDLSIVPPLSDDDKADYSTSIAQFGEDVIRKLRSNRYQHRVEALKTIKDSIIQKKHMQEEDVLMHGGKSGAAGGSGGDETSDDEDEFGVKKQRTPEEIAAKAKRREERENKRSEAKNSDGSLEVKLSVSNTAESDDDLKRLVPMAEVLSIALKDSLFHVVVAACDLIDGVLENFTFFDKGFIEDHFKATISALITRLKDSNPRTKDAAVATLLNLSAHGSIGPNVIVKLVAKSVPMPAGADSNEAVPSQTAARDDWRYTVAKIDLCHSILDAKPRFISALSDDCLRIATFGLGSANPQARKRAAAFFGLVRGECGAEGIKKYLATISPATIKKLKQELGIDDANGTFSLTLSHSTGTMTAAKMAAALTITDDHAAKEENEDIAAFEGDGDGEMITEDQVVLVDFLKEQFPQIKSFALLFSSRWNLRERLILRLHALLEDKSLNAFLAAERNVSGSEVTSGAGGKLVSPTHSSKIAMKRFMQKDDDDSDDDERTAANKQKSLPHQKSTGSLKTTSEAGEAGASHSSNAPSPSIITSSQLGAVIGICEKSFTDSVPAVAAAAVKLLKEALKGYSAEHQAATPPPPTPLDGATRDKISTPSTASGKPPATPNRNQSASVHSGAPAASSHGSGGASSDDIPSALHMLIPRLVPLIAANLTAEGAMAALTTAASFPFITLNGALRDIIEMDGTNTAKMAEHVAKNSVKLICARLDAASHLLATLTADKNIDIHKVMLFATAAFQHREPKARTSAAALVIEMYKRVGDRIQPHLEHIKGAVGDDLRAKMARITRREKEMSGGSARVRLAMFDGSLGSNAGAVTVRAAAGGNLSPTPAPPLSPSPQRGGGGFRGRMAGPAVSEDPADASASSPAVELAQGKNRKGNLVFS